MLRVQPDSARGGGAGVGGRVGQGYSTFSICLRLRSGTYNNQWMVLDLSKFTPGAAPATSDLLWIAEQIPGSEEALPHHSGSHSYSSNPERI